MAVDVLTSHLKISDLAKIDLWQTHFGSKRWKILLKLIFYKFKQFLGLVKECYYKIKIVLIILRISSFQFQIIWEYTFCFDMIISTCGNNEFPRLFIRSLV